MHAIIIGAGMGGLFAALALRKSGQFTSVDVYEQTAKPSTAGAGITMPPNGARLCKWLGVDLAGGDPKGPHGAVDGGWAAILETTRMVMDDGSISVKPLDHDTAANDGAGYSCCVSAHSTCSRTRAEGWFLRCFKALSTGVDVGALPRATATFLNQHS